MTSAVQVAKRSRRAVPAGVVVIPVAAEEPRRQVEAEIRVPAVVPVPMVVVVMRRPVEEVSRIVIRETVVRVVDRERRPSDLFERRHLLPRRLMERVRMDRSAVGIVGIPKMALNDRLSARLRSRQSLVA